MRRILLALLALVCAGCETTRITNICAEEQHRIDTLFVAGDTVVIRETITYAVSKCL